MIKFLVIAFVFAGPTFSQYLINHKHTKKSIIEGNFFKYGRSFSDKCRSVSGDIDVDSEKFESLYEAYQQCAIEVGDYVQCFRDLQDVFTNVCHVRSGSLLHLSDKQKTEMASFLQNYCPKVIDYVKCDDIVSPIYEKCYTTAEMNETSIGKASFLQMFENFCENNVEHLVKVINTEGIECGLSKGFSCFRRYGVSSDPFSNPRLRDFCGFYNMTVNCMGPVFKECQLSQTPDTLMRSFFTNIQVETVCADYLPNINNNRPHFV